MLPARSEYIQFRLQLRFTQRNRSDCKQNGKPLLVPDRLPTLQKRCDNPSSQRLPIYRRVPNSRPFLAKPLFAVSINPSEATIKSEIFGFRPFPFPFPEIRPEPPPPIEAFAAVLAQILGKVGSFLWKHVHDKDTSPSRRFGHSPGFRSHRSSDL